MMAAQMLVEGSLLGLYRYDGYRSKPPGDRKPDPEVMTVLHRSSDQAAQFEAGIARGTAISPNTRQAKGSERRRWASSRYT